MDDRRFFEGLMALREDKGKMAGLRRVLNLDNSRLQGLKIISPLGVTDLNDPESLPYKAVAFLFGATKAESLGREEPNLGASLRRAIQKKGVSDKDSPFDRRFDGMVACTSTKMLVQQHLTKLPGYLSGEKNQFSPFIRGSEKLGSRYC